MREYEFIVRPCRARRVVDLDFELSHHAKVMAGASKGPEEIRIFAGICDTHAAIGSYDLRFQ